MVGNVTKEQFPPAVTLILTIVFVSAYMAQLLLAGSLSYNAGIEAVRVVRDVVGAGSVVFTWVFHSDHIHFLENVVVFSLAGWWVENRVNQERLLSVIVLVLGIGANTAAAILFGTFGVGISGVTAGLVTIVALGHLEALLDGDVHFMRNASTFTLCLSFLLWIIGVIKPFSAGTAVEIHLLGVSIGIVWYAVEKYDHEFSYSLK